MKIHKQCRSLAQSNMLSKLIGPGPYYGGIGVDPLVQKLEPPKIMQYNNMLLMCCQHSTMPLYAYMRSVGVDAVGVAHSVRLTR